MPEQSNTTIVTAPKSRWSDNAGIMVTIGSFLITIVGALLFIGGWRSQVDYKLDDLDKRVTVAEGNQRTYIPVVIGMQHDLAYLADRARREDAERDDEDRGRR